MGHDPCDGPTAELIMSVKTRVARRKQPPIRSLDHTEGPIREKLSVAELRCGANLDDSDEGEKHLGAENNIQDDIIFCEVYHQ